MEMGSLSPSLAAASVWAGAAAAAEPETEGSEAVVLGYRLPPVPGPRAACAAAGLVLD